MNLQRIRRMRSVRGLPGVISSIQYIQKSGAVRAGVYRSGGFFALGLPPKKTKFSSTAGETIKNVL